MTSRRPRRESAGVAVFLKGGLEWGSTERATETASRFPSLLRGPQPRMSFQWASIVRGAMPRLTRVCHGTRQESVATERETMAEIAKAIATHNGGIVIWNLHGQPAGVDRVFNEVDKYLIDRPGYRVTITIEAEPGLALDLPPGIRASMTAGG